MEENKGDETVMCPTCLGGDESSIDLMAIPEVDHEKKMIKTGHFGEANLDTLKERVKDWQMADNLVFIRQTDTPSLSDKTVLPSDGEEIQKMLEDISKFD